MIAGSTAVPPESGLGGGPREKKEKVPHPSSVIHKFHRPESIIGVDEDFLLWLFNICSKINSMVF